MNGLFRSTILWLPCYIAMQFPTQYDAVISKIDQLDPVEYGRTRNYLSGQVTRLSPYISRGVISVRQVLDQVLARGYDPKEISAFIKELAWREYFQRTWQVLGDDLFDDIRVSRNHITRKQMPAALATANTGIEAIDNGIQELINTGYMHNHLRMYVASIACNIGHSHWPEAAKWMYYHLLDGDIASNTCSWQWVSGHFSTRPYYCNQENINKFTGSRQTGGFLDTTYEALPSLDIPDVLLQGITPQLDTKLPETSVPELDPALPLLIYNSYNLDPEWRKDVNANRVLLLEPSHFREFPVSEKVIRFILDLSRNIPGIRVYTGELHQLTQSDKFPMIFSKEHPAFNYYPGTKDQRDWIFPDTGKFHPSFFQFWRQQEKRIRNKPVIPLLKTA